MTRRVRVRWDDMRRLILYGADDMVAHVEAYRAEQKRALTAYNSAIFGFRCYMRDSQKAAEAYEYMEHCRAYAGRMRVI